METPDSPDALLTIAEIALGLAGYGGIFVAFGQGRGGERRPADSYRLVMLLSTALTTLFLALVPVALQALGLADTVLWRVASTCLGVATLVLMANAVRFTRRNREVLRAEEARGVAPLIWALALAVFGAQVASALGYGGERGYGLFLAGLVFLLSFGAYLFARMLFLWRS